ncbi:Ig-like domain-containing protein [uncultured Methanobrevibacter sp.]|uniref:Ig-like domain-containing protein n=1 Tax=uncultured Methanobrevibacter sp. TaxID=253161 RepID=UPI0025D82DD9|nr:Ig-like domain-containing protein [uncultured Methanobrevibacter sp.]
MDNKKIIVILVVIIMVLAISVGVLLFQSNSKQPSNIKIISDKKINKGDKLFIQLTDLNKTPLSNQKVNILITDKKGKIVFNKTVETNSKGKASFDLNLNKGNYNVNASYGGNDNYTGNNTTQKLTIDEVIQATMSNTPQNRYIKDEFGLFDQYNGVYAYGQFAGSTREEAEEYKWYTLTHNG